MSFYFTDVDEVLGPSAERFFGDGYRAVRARLRSVRRYDDAITGYGDLDYPGTWSMRSGRARTDVHMSSLDAVTLACRLLEAASAAEQVNALWLRSIELRTASSPGSSLQNVPLRAWPRDTERLEHEVSVGPFTVIIRLARHAGRAPTRDMPAGEDAWARLSTSLVRLHDLVIDPESQRLNAQDRATLPEENGWSLDSRHPDLSIADSIAIGGALAQALLYRLEGIGREEVGNFWLRRATITLAEPRPRTADSESWSVHAERRRLVSVSQQVFRSARVSITSSRETHMVSDVAFSLRPESREGDAKGGGEGAS
jgi:hypothetical protein